MAAPAHTTPRENVIQMPALELETQLSEIRAIADTMLYTHELVEEPDRLRVMINETALLFVIVEKLDLALKALERINRVAERRSA